MDLKHIYYYFKSIISPEDCKKIKDLGLKTIAENKTKGLQTEAITFGGKQKSSKKQISLNEKTIEEFSIENNLNREQVDEKTYIRDSEVCWLNDQWIYDLVYPLINEANQKAGWNFQFDYSEAFQFTQYNPGGFYGWHTDGGSDCFSVYQNPEKDKFDEKNLLHTKNENFIGKIRKLSLTLNLNDSDEYEGGNLKFDFGPHSLRDRFYECTEIRPKGSMIVFPSFIHHQVTPVKKGTRYSLVVWVLGQPFK